MRHVLAVAAVIVLSLSLGMTAGYMSVDLTPPGLNLLRPQTPDAVASLEQQEKARTIQAAASGCKYCADMAELAKTFTRRAETARSHAQALDTALRQVSDEKELFARRKDELKAARVAASRAEAAASILTNWAGRCTSEDFCKLPVTPVASACAAEDDSRPAAALLIAMSVRTVAQQCAGATCPSVDCKSSASLRSDMDRIEGELDEIGGKMSTAAAAQLPVGASTLNAEITRIADETHYVANMLPLLLDMGKASGDLPKLAPDLADQRAVSAADLATVMEQAAGVSDVKNDPRLEAAWRLKSMATHLATLGKSTVPSKLNWQQAAEALGASLLDLARLEALVDRRASKIEAGCDGSVASVAQQLREARAMLDHCRMRAACVGNGGAGATTKASTGDIEEVFSRATATAQGLVANEIGEAVIPVGDAEPSMIEMLRSQGVCRKASELIEASVAAPAATQAVAAAVAPALTPATGAISPQDLVSGAVQSALSTPPTGVSEDADVVPAAAPRTAKPSSEPELTQAAAPADRQEAAVPQFTGSAFGFAGGEGGPVVDEAPVEEPKKK